ncbi:MAG: hypothetical protein ACRD3N_09985 [Terracidiphilus sp.]
MRQNSGKALLGAATILIAASGAWASGAAPPQPAALPQANVAPNLDSAQIVAQMQRHNGLRVRELKHYRSLRVYRVEYDGYAAKIVARMEVEVNYDAASGKSFRIVSRSGSKFLLDKVLKRAVDSEEEASEDKESTALTSANYRFQLAGVETVDGRPAYVLIVDPINPTKFLYRGKIWVDARDFAVVKLDAAPAKSPSFWIDKTEIQFSNAPTGGYWLPERIRSKTWVRIGGTAVLTIDYGNYQVAPAEAQTIQAQTAEIEATQAQTVRAVAAQPVIAPPAVAPAVGAQ